MIKLIDGTNDHYVDENGTIQRELKSGGRKNKIQSIAKYGMKCDIGSGNNIRTNEYVARIVCNAFIDKPIGIISEDLIVGFHDLNTLNHKASNLYWINKYSEPFSIISNIDGVDLRNVNEIHYVGTNGKLYELLLGKFTEKKYKQDQNGYINAFINFKGVRKSMKMHRLVAFAFIENDDPEHKIEIDHIDENKSNNNIDNLRWCTGAENTEYYKTTDARDYHSKLRATHKLRMQEAQVKLNKALREVTRLQKDNLKLTQILEKNEIKFNKHVEKELQKVHKSKTYTGYANTTGESFGSIQRMVEQTGKPIVVDGIEYISCGTAAQYIVDSELKKGIVKNKATISKDMRRFISSDSILRTMYKTYKLTKAKK